MSEKRFFVKVYSNNEPFFFDEKQEYVEERYTCEDVRNLHPMEYWQVTDLLNEQQATIRRLQDLCGESDGENAKLRIENKMLEKDKAFAEDYANIFEKENVELRRENNRLEKEVNLLKPTNIEQYEQIQKLQEENRELRQSVEYWQKKYEEGTETFPIN